MISGLLVGLVFLFGGGISLAQAQSTPHIFKNNLAIGSTGADVNALQQILIAKGFLTSVTAPTGYFGSGTQAALKKFQVANGISPASGYAGPITRTFLDALTSASVPANFSPTNPAAATSVQSNDFPSYIE